MRDADMDGLLEMLSHSSLDWCISEIDPKDMVHLNTGKKSRSIICLFVTKSSINGVKKYSSIDLKSHKLWNT